MTAVAQDGFYRVGKMVGGKFRKAKWMWESVAGSEADAIRAEYGVGREMAAYVLERTPRDTSSDVQTFLDEIGQQLTRSVRNELHRFNVTAIVEDHAAAFALPGGFIFVAGSLVELCDRDRDEIAFVVAHEMAHVIRRHAIDRLLRQKALSAVSMASPARGWLAPLIRSVGVQWLERGHSQENEFEADTLGALLMRAAGFTPAGTTRLLERIGRLDRSSDLGSLGEYFSTHPPVRDRVLNLRRQLQLAKAGR